MTLAPRPRPFAERPKPGSLLPKPANDNEQGRSSDNSVLGRWQKFGFRFASPAAQEQWIRNAYQAGINANTWHLGDEVDPQTVELIRAGLGGPMAAIYLGPDGKYRSVNARTIEANDVRNHRAKHLSGTTMDQIAAAGKMPGEDEWVEQWKRAQPANDQAPVDQPISAVPDAEVGGAARTTDAAKKAAASVQLFRRGPVAGSQILDEAALQDNEDLTRIVINSITGDYGDEGRAALDAINAWWDGRSFSDAYAEQLAREKAETAAAVERQGLIGTTAEITTGFIPIVGDASGVVADIKDWKENSDEWEWDDYAWAAAGALPFVPNRKIVKGVKKIGDALLGNKRDAAASTTAKLRDELSDEIKRILPHPKTEFLTKGEALNLPGENRGVVYVLSDEPHLPHAAWYQGETPGTIYSVEHKRPADPSLRYDNPDGDDLIKFDGIQPDEDGITLILIDSKTAMAPKPGLGKVENTLKRIGMALEQNNANSRIKYKVYYDFPTEQEAARARKIVADLGYKDTITIRVRPATKLGQELFGKLREK